MAQGEYMLNAVLYFLSMKHRDVSDLKFLEIGASYGYLLHSLHKMGAREVLGVEPGEEGINGSSQYSVPMIRDFFPTTKLNNKKFDVILSHCMLEHVEDPLTMFSEMFKVTEFGGYIFFAVPDCEPKMSIADLSIISHQHINYFTKESIRNLRQRGLQCGGNDLRKRAILFGWGPTTKPVETFSTNQGKIHQHQTHFFSILKSCANIAA